MRSARSILAIACADFRERTRRYSFFLALLFAIFLGYATATGKVFIQFDGYRGIYTSAWIGTLVALVITCFLTLAGFYIVKNSVDRDRVTGVGQILAATPLSKTSYAFGKFLSNLAVLSSMVGVLALAALVMQFLVKEDPHIDLRALLSPFLLIAIPPLALTAAMAVVFEMLPGLRGGFGNVAWFFVWNFGLATPVATHRNWLDPTGIVTVMNSIGAEARQYVPNYHGGMSFQIDVGQHLHVVQDWRWPGIAWDARSILLRAMWLALACAIVPLAAIAFNRFDTAKFGGMKRPKQKAAVATALPQEISASAVTRPAAEVHLTPLVSAKHANAFGRIFTAELRLALSGRRWWWYLVALGLLIAQIFAPLDASRGPLLACAWLWAVFVWSPMGARETSFSTRPSLFSCAKILPRQLLACFLAGFAVACITGGGAAMRLALAGNSAGLLAWFAGASLLPAAALLLGIFSGTSKPFEALLTLAWYVGPMNHAPWIDFTGAANGASTGACAAIYLALAAGCIVLGLAIRSAQLRAI